LEFSANLKKLKTKTKVIEMEILLQQKKIEFSPFEHVDSHVFSKTQGEKYHWDFVLKEVCWLADDFQKERSRHRNNAKKQAKIVEAYLSSKEIRLHKRNKEETLNKKRIATKVAKDIRSFWLKINKIITFKQKADSEAIRQSAMDKHLTFMIKQTERYTNMLAETWKALEASPIVTISESRHPFKIVNLTEVPSQSNKAELDYEVESSDDDLSYVEDADNNDVDNDSTLLEQEAYEKETSNYKEEMDKLREEGEMSIDELRALYRFDGNMEISDGGNSEESIREDNDDVDEDEDDDDGGYDEVFEGRPQQVSKPERLESDTSNFSVFSIPYLISKNIILREYQVYGVKWLISMHDRRLNGILADEMGLGKTIQAITLIAYLAAYRGIWGPHLVVVPSSCIVNWESEFKKFCPSLKILTYFGSAKARKNLRNGWSKMNSFHICITSYQIVLQDAAAFRRKKWYYLILDEAHNIKNFKSKRWQTLLHFNSHRRLLLTGTPLQNNLLELWSLMHFLMPHLFSSRKEFSYWFSNPLNNMLENGRSLNSELISKLHGIMRPFILRRLKKDVAQQLPGKYEHILYCKMSKRQQYLYEDFMSRTSTKTSLTTSNYMGMMNTLMQLRKICNHPDLLEPRPVITSVVMDGVGIEIHPLMTKIMNYDPFADISDGIKYFWSDDVSLSTASSSFLSPNVLYCEETFEDQYLCSYSLKLAEYRNSLRKQRFDSLLRLSQFRVKQPTFWKKLPAMLMIQNSFFDNCDALMSVTIDKLFLSLKARSNSLLWMTTRFVFVIPKVISYPQNFHHFSQPNTANSFEKESGSEVSFASFNEAFNHQKIFLPDRKFVQYDSGKLQNLALLLRSLKKDGHKCLIFTQMTKMLDILECFLTMNNHNYVRLDGSTSIESRQILMDRFNSDSKLFCFILSTRSGGLGINLTGADTVIFYDTDWNPAMDAQAQDRAHRLGQSKDVHIYRLVAQSTVEENILLKAQQKRKLDHLVITDGDFTDCSLYSALSLKSVLQTDGPISNEVFDAIEVKTGDVEAAMVAVEDDDDIVAMQQCKVESKSLMCEFDDTETANIQESDGDDAANSEQGEGAAEEAEECGPEIDNNEFSKIINNLSRAERYAINFKSEIDPYYSEFFISQTTKQQGSISNDFPEDWNVDDIDIIKEEEERKALNNGDLIVTSVSSNELQTYQVWYKMQRQKRQTLRRLRQITGVGWKLLVEDGIPYWYNSDTGQYSYQTPQIILQLNMYRDAVERKFNGMPINVMVIILSFLPNYPDRMIASCVCARWKEASVHESFLIRVIPVELSAKKDIQKFQEGSIFSTLSEAILHANAGDTIVLQKGHYWESELRLFKPVRIMCESNDAAECIVELSGTIFITAPTILSGFTVRKSQNSVNHIINVSSSTLRMCDFILRNQCLISSEDLVANKSTVFIANSCFNGGQKGIFSDHSYFFCVNLEMDGVEQTAVEANQSILSFKDCRIRSSEASFFLSYDNFVAVEHCDINKPISCPQEMLQMKTLFLRKNLFHDVIYRLIE